MTDILTPVAVQQITVVSGNAFQVASQYLGDATQVDRIMSINPQLLGDPWWTGVVVINIPAFAPGTGTGGVIGPIPGGANLT